MKNILNLIIYLICIVLVIILCNNYLKNERKKVKNDEKFSQEKPEIQGTPTISFDYESVPEVKTKPLEERYIEELSGGANFYPKYNSDNFPDQRVIYDNEIYAKQIHTERTLDPIGKDDLPRTIAEIFDESITDFKKLTPLKQGHEGDFIVQGASDLAAFNPDYISYDDEKPENGGVFGKADRYKGNLNLQAFDPLSQTGSAVF